MSLSNSQLSTNEKNVGGFVFCENPCQRKLVKSDVKEMGKTS